MNLLWIKPGNLWPLNTGGRLRSFNMLAELSKQHEVTLLTTHRSDEDPEALQRELPRCKVISVPFEVPKQGSPGFARALVRSWLSLLPVDLWRWRSGAVRGEARRLLQGGDVDLCIADFLVSGPNVPAGTGVPVVYFSHNVEAMIWDRLQRLEKSLFKRLALKFESLKMRAFESAFCRRVDLTVAVSEADRDMLRERAPGASIHAIPTGVDTDYFAPDAGTAEAPAELVFTGSMDWYPNEDAMLYFMDRILPVIRRKVPGATLTIAGRNPGPRLKEAAGEGVTLTGTVDDIRPYIARAAVYIVPIRAGGGTRLKIFEACAMGKAVVSTTVGAEGLPLLHERHFLRADDPKGFARAVIRLLEDPACRRRLGAASRDLVLKRHAWPQVTAAFMSRCEQVLRPGQAQAVTSA